MGNTDNNQRIQHQESCEESESSLGEWRAYDMLRVNEDGISQGFKVSALWNHGSFIKTSTDGEQRKDKWHVKASLGEAKEDQ